MKKDSPETSVQFAYALRSKAVRCEDAYPKELTTVVFIDGVPANVQSAVRMFWSREQDANLLEIAKYADVLLEQTRRVRTYLAIPVRKDRFEWNRQTTHMLATVAESRSQFPKNIIDVRQKFREKSSPKSGTNRIDGRSQPVRHRRVCLAKDYQTETCPCTVCANKLALKRETNY